MGRIGTIRVGHNLHTLPATQYHPLTNKFQKSKQIYTLPVSYIFILAPHQSESHIEKRFVKF